MVTRVALVLLSLISAPDFSGSYKGSMDGVDVQLSLTQSGTKITGTAKIETLTAKLEARATGSNAEGWIELGEKLPIKMALSGASIAMKIGEYGDDGKADFSEPDEIAFTRVGGSPAAIKEPEGGKKFTTQPIDVLKNGKEYVHSSGGKFRYPTGWQVKEGDGYIQLIPPNAGDGELIIVSAESAQGKTDPADPEVLAYLDSVVSGAIPGANRVGKPEPAQAGNGKGIALTWKGGEKKVRAYVTILKSYGISVVAVGSESQVDARERAIKEIFFTLGWGQGKTDPRLVGKWQYYSYNATSGRETKAVAVLSADGKFSYQSDSEAANNYSGKDGLGNQTWTGWVNSRSGSGYQGTWTATGNTIILNFEDGSTEEFDFKFEQQGTAFVLKLYGADPKKPMEWSKIG
jgi:hypothetical protein